MNNRLIGMFYAVLSAIIYGFTPILARMAFDGGANGITVTFLRGILAIPLLFVLLKVKEIPLGLKGDWKAVLLVGLLGMSLTTILLYMSYNYLPVGMSTTLHFTYPILVTAACAIFFKEKINRWKITALILCSMGIALFVDQVSSTGITGITGMTLALLSGATFSLYIIGIDRSQLRHMHYLKLTFYLNVLMSGMSGILGLCTGGLTFSLTPKAWFLCALVSVFISLGALPLLQQGIKLAGASTSAILSTLEPITSVILGMLILHETVSPLKLVGCVLIIGSILLIALSEWKQDRLEPVETAEDEES